MNTPWDTPQPPLDYPQSAKVISLHRATVVPISLARAARATRDPGMLAALAERAEEIAYDDFYVRGGMTRLGGPARHLIVRAPSRLERITWWLGDTFWLLLGAIAAGVLLVVAFYAGWTA